MDKNKQSSLKTLKAARKFTRRTALKRGAAAAALVGAAPLFVKNAFAASSGEVNVLMWGEYLPDSVVADFKAKTGITVNHTKIGDNGEIIAKMKAGGGAGFDLASPTNMRALQWENLGVLAPFDMNKITNLGNVNPGMVAVGDRDWNFGGKGSHWVPQLWGTESIAWRTDKWTPNGLTQKRSRCSGSRTVICPATPSARRSLPRTRSPAASLCFLCKRSVSKSVSSC